MEELLRNINEAVEGCLSVPISLKQSDVNSRVMEISV
jgi:hypothetical protein